MADNEKDRRELLKLRQGLVDEKDSEIKETGYDVKMPKTAGEKAKNWLWYHTVIIVCAVLLIGLGILIYFMFFVKEVPDISIYSVGNYAMSVRTNCENSMSPYVPDFDGNGKHRVSITQAVPDEFLGETELCNELVNGNCEVFIGSKEELQKAYDSFTTAGKEPLFSDLSQLTGEEGYIIDLRQTAYGKSNKLFYTELYAAVRNSNDEKEENGLKFIENLIGGTMYIKSE